MEKVKVLYFVDRMLMGGIQSLVLTWASRFDKKKIQVDFLLLDDGKEYELEAKLKTIGCNVYKLKGVWVKNPLDFIKYGHALDDFFREHHDYKVVHLHSSSKNYQVLKYAKKYGIPIRIAHSHCTDFQTENILKKAYGNILKRFLIHYSTDYFACSKLAGEWLFGKKIVETDKFKIIHNAVDYDRFKSNEEIRKRVRKEFHIKDSESLIGHVGRFTNAKNHTFLIDIFNEYHKINKSSKLLLVGTGILEDEIKQKVKKLGLEDYVIFAGFRTNINELMQAMDCFLFPSLSEGLGLVLIEAQAAGIYCFTSKDVVPDEAKVSNYIKYISLSDSPEKWAKEINGIEFVKNNNYESIKKSGYLIDDIIITLEEVYK